MTLRSIAAGIALLFIGACSGDGSPVDFPPLTFTRYEPIFLDVSNIEIVDEYKSPTQPPYVEHLLPYSPAEAMRIWVKDRLRAIGSSKSLQVIIRDGSVKATELHKDNGIEDFFTIDQDYRYDAVLEVELRIYEYGSPLSKANVSTTVRKSITMSENAGAQRRNGIFRKLIADMMDQANAELERNMFLYMGNYISYSQNP